jgi:ribosome-associated protein
MPAPNEWCEWLREQKAVDVEVHDLEGISPIVDTMILATALNGRHLGVMAEEAMLHSKQLGAGLFAADGLEGREWVVLDFGDLMVHLLLPEVREKLDLEDHFSNMSSLRDEGDEA